MTQVLIPFIDKTFRTLTDRDHRAMAGLSMGGMQTFQVTFNHLDLFSYIGGFSGAANVFAMGNNKLDTKTSFHGAMADPAAFAKRVHLLWIGVGTNEPERMKSGLERSARCSRRRQSPARFLRVTGYRPRMADVAARLERFCTAIVPADGPTAARFAWKVGCSHYLIPGFFRCIRHHDPSYEVVGDCGSFHPGGTHQSTIRAQHANPREVLWYRTPAPVWDDAPPIGDDQMSGMISLDAGAGVGNMQTDITLLVCTTFVC